jgi:hypothetical protein
MLLQARDVYCNEYTFKELSRDTWLKHHIPKNDFEIQNEKHVRKQLVDLIQRVCDARGKFSFVYQKGEQKLFTYPTLTRRVGENSLRNHPFRTLHKMEDATLLQFLKRELGILETIDSLEALCEQKNIIRQNIDRFTKSTHEMKTKLVKDAKEKERRTFSNIIPQWTTVHYTPQMNEHLSVDSLMILPKESNRFIHNLNLEFVDSLHDQMLLLIIDGHVLPRTDHFLWKQEDIRKHFNLDSS